jgi:hypothetical protein
MVKGVAVAVFNGSGFFVDRFRGLPMEYNGAYCTVEFRKLEGKELAAARALMKRWREEAERRV